MNILERMKSLRLFIEALWRFVRLQAILKNGGVLAVDTLLSQIHTTNNEAPLDVVVADAIAAIQRAIKWIPFEANCFQQSVVLCWMLRSRGFSTTVAIGVYKYPFRSHAWVESGSELIQWRAGFGLTTGLPTIKAMQVIHRLGENDISSQSVDQVAEDGWF